MAEFIPNPARGKEVYDLDRKYVFHSWSAQGQITPLPIAGGSGSYFWDFDGKKYLDFSCQLVFTNIGFQHPKVIDAIKKQADLLTTIAPQAANEARGEAASRIVALASPSHEKVFFTNGGADGVENAIRMARIHTSRHKILSFYRSYHGNTTSAISATGDPRRWPNEFAFGHVHFFGPYLYRSAFWAKSEEEECQRALEHLESVIEFEGPKTIGNWKDSAKSVMSITWKAPAASAGLTGYKVEVRVNRGEWVVKSEVPADQLSIEFSKTDSMGETSFRVSSLYSDGQEAVGNTFGFSGVFE